MTKEPRFAIVALYSHTATLYDYDKGIEIDAVDVTYADDSEVNELYEKCAMLNAKHEEDLVYLKNVKEITRLETNNEMRTISYINHGDIWLYEKDYHLIMNVIDNVMVNTKNYATDKDQSIFLDFLLASGKRIQRGNGKNLFQYFEWVTLK